MPDPAAPRPVELQPETDGFIFPFLPIITPKLALEAARKAASKDKKLSLHTPEIERLAHILNFVRWKLWAGPRCDSPSQEQIDEDKAAWETIHDMARTGRSNWARDGIWPDVATALIKGQIVRQGYAVRTRHERLDNIDVASTTGGAA
jgi:hypothetical protein